MNITDKLLGILFGEQIDAVAQSIAMTEMALHETFRIGRYVRVKPYEFGWVMCVFHENAPTQFLMYPNSGGVIWY